MRRFSGSQVVAFVVLVGLLTVVTTPASAKKGKPSDSSPTITAELKCDGSGHLTAEVRWENAPNRGFVRVLLLKVNARDTEGFVFDLFKEPGGFRSFDFGVRSGSWAVQAELYRGSSSGSFSTLDVFDQAEAECPLSG